MAVVFEKLKSDITSAKAEYVRLLTKNMNQVIKNSVGKIFSFIFKKGCGKITFGRIRKNGHNSFALA